MKSIVLLILSGLAYSSEKLKKKDEGNRVLMYPHPGVIEEDNGMYKFPTEAHESAFKVARYIRDVFFFIDKNADDNIEIPELLEIYEKFKWPKYTSKSDKEMV